MTQTIRAEEFELAQPVTTAPASVFSYSHEGQGFWRQRLIRGVEALTGRNRLERAYFKWRSGLRDPRESVFTAAVKALRLQPEIVAGNVQDIPRKGGLLVVANHPFGIADGLALCHLIAMRRPDVKLMAHSLLCRVPEARDAMLPVDFSAGPEARRITAQSRQQAVDWLDRGHALVIFPAGGVSTVPTPLARQAADPAWHPFVARLAVRPGVEVLPIYVHGQNSRLFQIVSHWSYPLRVALIFRETLRLRNKPLRLSLGPRVRVPVERKAQAVKALREATFGMAGPEGPGPEAEFVFPSRIRW